MKYQKIYQESPKISEANFAEFFLFYTFEEGDYVFHTKGVQPVLLKHKAIDHGYVLEPDTEGVPEYCSPKYRRRFRIFRKL